MRQIVLDTETTGLDPSQGHRIIEIGCVELIGRKLTGRHYHQYINPQRLVDEGAMAVHGISNEFLEDKPLFSKIYPDFLEFVRGAELIIHNAPFDIGFIDHEFRLLKPAQPSVTGECDVIDTLVMARQKHPGQKNTLDALCKRYGVDNSQRDLHGALLDAEILADVYLFMTGGQRNLLLSGEADNDGDNDSSEAGSVIKPLEHGRHSLPVIKANEIELMDHEAKLDALDKAVGGECVWRR